MLESLQEIERASFDSDAAQIADSYTITNYTPTRTLDASTATVTDVANVLATLLFDMRKRGAKKG